MNSKKTTDRCQWFFYYDNYLITKVYNDFSILDTNV